MNVDELFALLVGEIRELRAAVERLSPAPARRLVDAAAVATALGVDRSWVYRHALELGGVPLGDGPRPRLRFDLEAASERFACLAGERSHPASGQQSQAIAAPDRRAGTRRRRSPASGLPEPGSVLRVRPRATGGGRVR
jgi:hypothetical protein